MSKFKLLLLIFSLSTVSYYFSKDLGRIVLSTNDYVLNKIFNSYENISSVIKRHFYNTNQIKQLSEENKQLKNYKVLYDNLLIDYEALSKLHNVKKYNFDLSLARILNYVKLGDLNKFWLDYPNLDSKKIYGLVYKDSAVGIMFENNNRAYALSIYDEKSVISVRIGNKQVPAIAKGAKNAVYADFIIDYEKINVGDDVFTSGKDSIFIDGIYVGRVEKIIDEAGYKRALLTDTKMLFPYKYVSVVNIDN